MLVFRSRNPWKNLNRALTASIVWVLLSIVLKIIPTTAQAQVIESSNPLTSVFNLIAFIIFALNTPVIISLGIAAILCLICLVVSIFEADLDTDLAMTRFYKVSALLLVTAFIFTGFRVLTEPSLIILLAKAKSYSYGPVETAEIVTATLLALIFAGRHLFQWLRNYLLL